MTISLFIKLIQKLIVFGKLKDNIVSSFACLKFQSFRLEIKNMPNRKIQILFQKDTLQFNDIEEYLLTKIIVDL